MAADATRMLPPSKLALLLLVFSLGFMMPGVRYPLLVTDLLFLLAVAAYLADVARGRARLRWQSGDGVLAAYGIALSASVLVSRDVGRSLFKAASIFYLIALAWLTSRLVETEADLRRVVLAWLAATAVVLLIGFASLLAFFVDPNGWLVETTRYRFGTLPPGDYPRLALTFFNANMLCNYLAVSLGLLLVARHQRWVGSRAFSLLLAGMLAIALFTISPELGGIALLGGSWWWLLKRDTKPLEARLILAAGIGVATALLAALAVTPIIHPTAPFLIRLPGGYELAPSGRFLTWSVAVREWAQHPLLGHGLGIDAVSVSYRDPSGNLQHLTDAHNLVLSIAAQCGWIGVAGLALLVGYAARLTWRSSPVCAGLGLTFLIAFLYQGMGGSFEDARHLWVLLGLLFAAHRMSTPVAQGSPSG